MLVLVNKLSYGNAVNVIAFGQIKRKNERGGGFGHLFLFFFQFFFQKFSKKSRKFSGIGESYSSFEFKIIKPNGLSSTNNTLTVK
jgi:hypothetical protein